VSGNDGPSGFPCGDKSKNAGRFDVQVGMNLVSDRGDHASNNTLDLL